MPIRNLNHIRRLGPTYTPRPQSGHQETKPALGVVTRPPNILPHSSTEFVQHPRSYSFHSEGVDILFRHREQRGGHPTSKTRNTLSLQTKHGPKINTVLLPARKNPRCAVRRDSRGVHLLIETWRKEVLERMKTRKKKKIIETRAFMECLSSQTPFPYPPYPFTLDERYLRTCTLRIAVTHTSLSLLHPFSRQRRCQSGYPGPSLNVVLGDYLIIVQCSAFTSQGAMHENGRG
ncbi:hypothetical protein WG66_005605 [Moniliophthora roreri]|nr:hypothetical protein WG66_005605 [Moniliophthora roreri]